MYSSLLLAVLCFTGRVLSNGNPPCEIGDQTCLDILANSLAPIVLTAIPELGVESSDPLFVPEISGNVTSFKYKLLNSTLLGYSKCKISNLHIIGDFSKFGYDIDCQQMSLTGNYEFHGQFLTYPVEGSGEYELITGRYLVYFESDFKQAELDNGKISVALTTFKVRPEPQTPMKFDFKNLYNGQKDLSDNFHKFIHQHWREIAFLVQDRIWYACMEKVVDNINTYLKYYTIDDFIKM